MSECADSSQWALLAINAINTAGMEGATSSLAVSCAESSMIGSVSLASEQTSAQGCLPSSLRAALNFVSGHPTLGPQKFVPFSPERFQNGLNFRRTGAKTNPIVIEDEQDEEKSPNYTEKQNNYVYKRRKLQGNSVSLLPKQIQIAAGKECLPNDMLNSDWLSQSAQIENFAECHDDIKYCDASVFACSYMRYSMNLLPPGKKMINSNSNGYLEGGKYKASAGMFVDCKAPDSEDISLYHTGSSGLLLDAGKMDLNIVDVGEASSGSRSVVEDCMSLQVQSSSSFEMSDCNLGQLAVSVKHELTDLAECTSSVGITHLSRETDLEKEWCISVLKQCGLLGWFVSSGEYAAAGHPGLVGDGSFPQLCKICGSLEDSTRTLICDMCDEAFHMSCCNPKIKSVPAQDDWYCQLCRKKRKRPGKKCLIESKSPQSIVKENCTNLDKSAQDKAGLFSHMLDDSEPYTTQVRIGKAFQADVPDWTANVPESKDVFSSIHFMNVSDAEMFFLGEPLEKEFPEQNLINELWSKGWQPARSCLPGSIENWLQCQNVICVDGACSDGEKVKDVICAKWRRAPLSQVQNDEWDCSCAVVWDPVHADCAVPQELKTEDIIRRLKATETAKPQLVYKKRKSKMNHCIAGEDRGRIEGPILL